MKKALPIIGVIWLITIISRRTYGSASDVSPFVWVMSMPLTAVSTTFAVGNFVYVGKGYEAPKAWRIGGFVSGALNIVAGTVGLFMFPAINEVADKPQGKGACYALAGTMIGVGVITIASAIWSSSLPSEYGEHHGPWVDISPLLLRDSNNSLAGGVAVSLVGW